MGASARFYSGARGRRYFYARDATMRCPYARGDLPDWLDGSLAVRRLNDSGLDLAHLIERAHARHGARLVDPGDPKRCGACLAYLVRVGVAAWIEAMVDDPLHDEAVKTPEQRAGLEMTRTANKMFGETHVVVADSRRHFATKREAIQWAREQAEQDRAAEVLA